MKKRINLNLSEEAVQILQKQSNMSEYVEKLILDTPDRTLEVVSVSVVRSILEEVLEKKSLLPSAKIVDGRHRMEASTMLNDEFDAGKEAGAPQLQECCTQEKPCKHWVWDVNTGDGWINTITGEVRES